MRAAGSGRVPFTTHAATDTSATAGAAAHPRISISAIARVEGIAWNTAARWLEKAAAACRRFNNRTITAFAVEELQADEIRTFVGTKGRPSWIFVGIEVWPSTVVGRRSYRNTLALVRDVSKRMDFQRLALIVTDGFDFYEKVVRRVFGPACLYGQLLKTRRRSSCARGHPYQY